MGDSRSLDVETELGIVEVHKMPLKDYAELLRALKNLPRIVSRFADDDRDFKDIPNDEMFDIIRDLLIDSWDDLINVIAVPTNKDGEFLGKLDGPDSIDVIDAILELNNVPRIIESIKKIAARRAQFQKKPQAQNKA